MYLNIKKASTIINKYYFSKKDYDIYSDINLTYQEFLLIINCVKSNDNWTEIDYLKLYSNHWLEFEASKFQNMIIDKNWDEVFVDRAHGRKTASKLEDIFSD